MEIENTMKKHRLCGTGIATISLILTIVGALLFYLFPFVDDVPYEETIEEHIVDYSDFRLSDATKHGTIKENAFVISPGEGEKMFSSELSLMEGDLFRVTFTIDNETGENAKMTVDLFGPGYDLSGMEKTFDIAPGENQYSVILPYYRAYRPGSCELRFFTPYDTSLVITDLNVVRQNSVVGGNRLVKAATAAAGILFVVSACILFWNLFWFLRGKPKREKKKFPWQELLMYLGITGIVLVTLLILYRNVEITCPLNVSGDAMGVHYYAKLIDEYGVSLVGHRTGGMSGADMYDYPYSDTLSFLLVKTIGLFTDNPYFISNLFYFLCFFLAAIISAACMRYLKVGRIPAMALSVLYAFSPYIQQRYGHMWLVPYFMMPVACVIAIDIMRDTVHSYEEREKQKKHFYCMLFLAFCCAFTGLYYAFFACALITVGMIILWLNRPVKGFKRYIYPFGYLAAVLTGVAVNVLPNALYHMIHGANPAGDLELRMPEEAEIFGLKLVELLLPQNSHRIPALAELTRVYTETRPLVNENRYSTLGIVAAVGLIISLVFLFRQKKEKEISYLNIAMILLGTIGGISSVATVVVDIPIRCYNRLSVVIMFLSLLQVALLLDVLGRKVQILPFIAIMGGIMVMGIYDQTFTYREMSYQGSPVESLDKGLQEIEASVPEGSYVFQLPFSPWPTGNSYRNFFGYLGTDTLHWSYGAYQGREESDWQARVASADVDSLVRQIKEAGYTGLYLDRASYENVYGVSSIEYEEQIRSMLGEPDVQDPYGVIAFWKL